MPNKKTTLLKRLRSAIQNLAILSSIFQRENFSTYEEDFKSDRKFADEYMQKIKKDIDFLNKNGVHLPILFKTTNMKQPGDIASFAEEINELKYEKTEPEKALMLEGLLKNDFKEMHEALQKAIFRIEKNLPVENDLSKKQDIRICGSFSFNFSTGEVEGNKLKTQFKFKDKRYKLLKLLMSPPGEIKTYEEIAKIYNRNLNADFIYELRDDIKKIKESLKILPQKDKKNKDIFRCNKGYFVKCK